MSKFLLGPWMDGDLTGLTCDHCGEDATRRDWLTKQPICDDCGRGEDDEPPDGHPLGGMGYGIDYSETLREARKLK